VFCVYTLSLCTPAGRAIYRQIACARKDFGENSCGARVTHLRQLVRKVMKDHEPALRAAVLAAYAGELAAAASSHAQAIDALERRERAMSASLRSTARELVQLGLFDARGMKAIDARRRTAGALLQPAQERLRSLAGSRRLVTNIELTAILFTSRWAR
jgi:hypothetical protein